MVIKSIRTKTLSIFVNHNGIEIFHIDSGFKWFFVGYNLNDAKKKFKEMLKTELSAD